MPIYLTEVALVAMQHLTGAVPHLPAWARCLSWWLTCCGFGAES